MSAKRRAFTLFELFVVITIICLLLALFLPEIHERGPGRKTTCLNNVTQLAKAILTYESAKRKFPGYDNPFPSAKGTPNHGSWVVSILPNIDRADVYNQWTGANGTPTVTTVYLELCVCPSNPPDSPTGNPLGYVANCGRPDISAERGPLNESALGNGVFFNLYDNTPFINMDYLTSQRADGAGTTLMLSENLSAGNWTAVDTKTTEITMGFVWFDSDDTDHNRKINGNAATAPRPASSYDHARPSSRHRGGVNVVFCDSHGKFLSEDIDYNVYIQLMTSSSQKSDAPAAVKSHALQETDYDQ